ncbi:GM12404 [Drosophila sechellia]|uniref:GM12404 n=1 Tax=Drosophila sechellia TaxID=7238 RepID=B4I0Q2_DROSE|nr:GM12404 [Drosophila sechellia]
MEFGQNHKFTITTQLPQQCTAPRGLGPFDPPSDPLNHQPNNLPAHQSTNPPPIAHPPLKGGSKQTPMTQRNPTLETPIPNPNRGPNLKPNTNTTTTATTISSFGSEELYGKHQGRT